MICQNGDGGALVAELSAAGVEGSAVDLRLLEFGAALCDDEVEDGKLLDLFMGGQLEAVGEQVLDHELLLKFGLIGAEFAELGVDGGIGLCLDVEFLRVERYGDTRDLGCWHSECKLEEHLQWDIDDSKPPVIRRADDVGAGMLVGVVLPDGSYVERGGGGRCRFGFSFG